MYTVKLPFKDFKNKPRNAEIHFNLAEWEIMMLLAEFQGVIEWRSSIDRPETFEVKNSEVREFFDNLQTIVLEAWGEPSEDGLYFEKSDKYKFQSSAMFAAIMRMFLADPMEGVKLLDGLITKEFQELIMTASQNIEKAKDDPRTTPELKAEIERLQGLLPQEAVPVIPVA